MSFAKEAWPFVVPFLFGAAIVLALGWPRTALVVLVVGVAVLLFFRVPRRQFAGDPRVLLAPASGRVTSIEEVSEPSVGPGKLTRIVTFLSVFDVHVQRAPANGKVVATAYRRGRKVAAFRKNAGEVNESRTTVFELESGESLAVRQIAGLLARRVVGYLDEGDEVERGDLIGIIKFGSRVDLFLPEGYSILVSVGQRVHEGATPIAAPPSAS